MSEQSPLVPVWDELGVPERDDLEAEDAAPDHFDEPKDV